MSQLFLVFLHLSTRAWTTYSGPANLGLPPLQSLAQGPQHCLVALAACLSAHQTGEYVMVGREDCMVCKTLSFQNLWRPQPSALMSCRLALSWRINSSEGTWQRRQFRFASSSVQRPEFTVLPHPITAQQHFSHSKNLQTRLFLLIAHSLISSSLHFKSIAA